MALTDPIVWSEGLVLTPQHLQQNDLRMESLLGLVGRLSNPFFWGFSFLEFEDNALSEGVFSLRRARGVFPSGLVFSYDSQVDPALRSTLPEVRAGASLSAYMAVRQPVVGSKMVAGETGRFGYAPVEEVSDRIEGDGSGQVGRLRPRLSIMFDKDQQGQFELMEVARLRVRGGTLVREPYLPPPLIVHARHPLHIDCVALARSLREKAALLGEKLSTPGLGGGEAKVNVHRRIFETILRELPSFEARLSLPQCHPLDLYLDLARLCASVITSLDVQEIPPRGVYRHDETRSCFASMITACRGVVERLGALFLTRQFARDGRRFVVEGVSLEHELLVGVQVGDSGYRNDAIRWFERAQIGSASRIAEISARRTYGAGRQKVEAHEAYGITESSQMALFVLDSKSADLVEGQPLYIEGAALTPGLASLSLVLFAPPAKESSEEIYADNYDIPDAEGGM